MASLWISQACLPVRIPEARNRKAVYSGSHPFQHIVQFILYFADWDQLPGEDGLKGEVWNRIVAALSKALLGRRKLLVFKSSHQLSGICNHYCQVLGLEPRGRRGVCLQLRSDGRLRQQGKRPEHYCWTKDLLLIQYSQ